jgi:hypothetical protein
LLLRPVAILYAIWVWYDWKRPFRGSRFNACVHRWSLWTHLANYFPMEVHKTAELPIDQNYMIAWVLAELIIF